MERIDGLTRQQTVRSAGYSRSCNGVTVGGGPLVLPTGANAHMTAVTGYAYE